MKCLSNFKTKVEGSKVIIEAELSEKTFAQRVQQVTIPFFNAKNIQWPRHCQISQEAFFVKAFGSGVGILLSDLVSLAALLEPKTTFPPQVGDLDNNLKVEINSEISPFIQWQVSDNIDNRADWNDIEGATGLELDKSKVKVGQFVRVIARSEAGEMISRPAIVA